VGRPEVWIPFVAVLGGCIGSFLNVVIYRLPLGLSVAEPRWSFCPRCERRIRAGDNIPILGWLRLRGRCRDCGLPIAPIYPVVECLTLLLFVAIWDAGCLANVLIPSGLPNDFASAWPFVLAYGVLFSGLMATSVMDLESYLVDIRVCNWTIVFGAALAGVFAFTCGRPATTILNTTPDALPPVVVAASLAAGAGWLLTAVVLRIVRGPIEYADESTPADQTPAPADTIGPASQVEAPTGTADAAMPVDPNTSPLSHAPDGSPPETTQPTPDALPVEPPGELPPIIAPVLALSALVAGLVVWPVLRPEWPTLAGLAAGQVRGLADLFVFSLMLLLAARVHRESDDMVITEIESQRQAARPTALREFATFLPALLAAAGAVYLWRSQGHLALDAHWADLIRVVPATAGPSAAVLAAHALAAAVLAAALGWTVRILGTLAFGKEAFGTGDIYILGAIGAVGGFWFAVMAFFLAAFLALIGVAVLVFHKRSRAIPFGPWLALGAFLALYLRTPLVNVVSPVASFFWGQVAGSGSH